MGPRTWQKPDGWEVMERLKCIQRAGKEPTSVCQKGEAQCFPYENLPLLTTLLTASYNF